MLDNNLIPDNVKKTVELMVDDLEKRGLVAAIHVYMRDPKQTTETDPMGKWNLCTYTSKGMQRYDSIMQKNCFEKDSIL